MAIFLNKTTLVDVSNQLKNRHHSVALTHGAFDLFHVGHAALVKESKKFCDFLIVGVDSDKRVKKYKGAHRPVIPFDQRVDVLLQNKNIDFVYALDDSLSLADNYFCQMYELISPNVITFGKYFGFEDRMKKRQELLGAISFVQISHEFDEVQSATKIIEKIKNS